jgi:hypothetical protein
LKNLDLTALSFFIKNSFGIRHFTYESKVLFSVALNRYIHWSFTNSIRQPAWISLCGLAKLKGLMASNSEKKFHKIAWCKPPTLKKRPFIFNMVNDFNESNEYNHCA